MRVVTVSYLTVSFLLCLDRMHLLNILDVLHLWLVVVKKFEGGRCFVFPELVVMRWFGQWNPGKFCVAKG
jgi:hypothetical protein